MLSSVSYNATLRVQSSASMFNQSKPKAMKTKLDYILSFIGFCGILSMSGLDSEDASQYFIVLFISAFFLVAGKAIKLPFLPYED